MSLIVNDYTFVYIDPVLREANNSIGEGTGETPTSPLFNFPSSTSAYGDKTIFLIRRSASEFAANLPVNTTLSGVEKFAIWGMPISPYQKTTDTTFQQDVEYYTRSTTAITGGEHHEYIKQEVIVGDAIPADTTYYILTTRDNGLWDLVPSEVKDLWYDDPDEEPNVGELDTRGATKAFIQYTGTYSCGLINDSCSNFDMRNIVYRCDFDSSISNNTNHNASLCYGICCTNTSTGCSVNIDNVWFRSSVDWVATNNKPSKLSNGGSWLCINDVYGSTTTAATTGYSASITNSRIDLYSCVGGTHVNLGNSNNINIDTIEVNVAQGSSSLRYIPTTVLGFANISRSSGSTSIGSVKPIVTIKNVTARYAYNDAAIPNTMMPTIISGSAEYATITNCNYTKLETNDWSPYNNTITFNPFIEIAANSAGTSIDTVFIEYRDIAGVNSYGVRLMYNDSSSQQVTGQYNHIKNFTCICATDTPKYTDKNYIYGDNGDNIYSDGASTYHLLSCSHLNASDTTAVASDFLLQNISINAPRGKAIYAYSALMDMKSNNISGGVYLKNSMGKIGSLNLWYPGYVLFDAGKNLIYIGTITCNRSNPDYEYNAQSAIAVYNYTGSSSTTTSSSPSWNSHILVNKCNINLMNNNPDTTSTTMGTVSNCTYICTNDNNYLYDGSYTVRNRKSFCKTWSVARVGSISNCSLKLYNETADDASNPLIIGGAPFKGITMSVSEPGNYLAKIYVTTYGYNNPEQISNHLNGKLTKANGDIIYSSSGSWASDTTSEWLSIDHGTAYVLTIPFTIEAIPESGSYELEFEYQFSWYFVGAATFLDPFPTIEKVQ